jgi:hypothetical protein
MAAARYFAGCSAADLRPVEPDVPVEAAVFWQGRGGGVVDHLEHVGHGREHGVASEDEALLIDDQLLGVVQGERALA